MKQEQDKATYNSSLKLWYSILAKIAVEIQSSRQLAMDWGLLMISKDEWDWEGTGILVSGAVQAKTWKEVAKVEDDHKRDTWWGILSGLRSLTYS